MSYLQHFGLKYDPFGKNIRQAVYSTQAEQLKHKLTYLLQSKGIGLITGDAGTGKTTALREWVNTLNPMTHHVIYQPDNHFRAFDIYCQLAESLGLEKQVRYSRLWRELKKELLNMVDNKQLSPIWILDEVHLAPPNFFAELPAFLNFSFDSREIMTIILVGLPSLKSTLKKSIYSPLHSRILFQCSWQTIEDLTKFCEFMTEAIKNAGIHNAIISQSGTQLIYMASKGKLRYVHKILTRAFQKATEKHFNHLPDDIIQEAIDEVLA